MADNYNKPEQSSQATQFNMGIEMLRYISKWLNIAADSNFQEDYISMKKADDNVLRVLARYIPEMNQDFQEKFIILRKNIIQNITSIKYLKIRLNETKLINNQISILNQVDRLGFQLEQYDIMIRNILAFKGIDLKDLESIELATLEDQYKQQGGDIY